MAAVMKLRRKEATLSWGQFHFVFYPPSQISYPLPIFIAPNSTPVELYLLFPTHLASIRVLSQP